MTGSYHHGRHRRPTLGRRLTTVSMMAAAGAAGWLATATIAEPQPAQAPPPPAAAPTHEPIQASGQVIAVSRDSLTTTTPDGQTMTFRITPDTAQIGQPQTKGNVVVVGVVHDGVPVATAIADQSAVGSDGPPMDYELPT